MKKFFLSLKQSAKKITKHKRLLALLVVLGSFLFVTAALALETAWPKSPFPNGIDIMQLEKDKKLNLGEFIKYLYEWGIALGGVATFVAFVIAGFQYIISVGNPQMMKDSMDRVKSAIFGLILLLSSFVLLKTINPELTKFKLQPFNPEAVNDVFATCDTDKDCPDPSYRCVPSGKTGSGKKGICFPKTEDSTVCYKAVICDNTDFGPPCEDITVGQIVQKAPKSVKAWFKDPNDNNKEKECNLRDIPDPENPGKRKVIGDFNGCGCLLRLYGKQQSWLWASCGDVIKNVPAYEPDLTQWADRDVFCVGLFAPETLIP
jgi:hypothetical protein